MFLQQPRPESVRPKGPAGSGAGEPPLSAFAGARAEAAGVGCGTEPRTLRPMWQSQRLVPRAAWFEKAGHGTAWCAVACGTLGVVRGGSVLDGEVGHKANPPSEEFSATSAVPGGPAEGRASCALFLVVLDRRDRTRDLAGSVGRRKVTLAGVRLRTRCLGMLGRPAFPGPGGHEGRVTIPMASRSGPPPSLSRRVLGAKHQVIAASSTRFHGCRYRSLRRLRPSRRTSGVECGVWSRDRRSRSLARQVFDRQHDRTPVRPERDARGNPAR